MSTVKADYLVNAAGTGAPTFTNEATVNGDITFGGGGEISANVSLTDQSLKLT